MEECSVKGRRKDDMETKEARAEAAAWAAWREADDAARRAEDDDDIEKGEFRRLCRAEAAAFRAYSVAHTAARRARKEG